MSGGRGSRSISIQSATCLHAWRAKTSRSHQSSLAVTWTLNRLAGSLTVRSACSPLWQPFAQSPSLIAPRRAIEVVNWTTEEGARFSPGLMGSAAVYAGVIPLESANSIMDRSGRTVGEELARIRYRGDAPMGTTPDSYFELHIEQGPELEAAGVAIGAVTSGHHSTYTDMERLGDRGPHWTAQHHPPIRMRLISRRAIEPGAAGRFVKTSGPCGFLADRRQVGGQ